MRDLIRQESGLLGIKTRAARRPINYGEPTTARLSNPTAHDLDVSDMNFYDLHYDGGLADNAGHLIVD